jgi:hypothetical protein
MLEFLRAVRYAAGLYRCFPCGRLRLLHQVRDLHRCDSAPLPITITPAGLAALEGQGEDLERVATR